VPTSILNGGSACLARSPGSLDMVMALRIPGFWQGGAGIASGLVRGHSGHALIALAHILRKLPRIRMPARQSGKRHGQHLCAPPCPCAAHGRRGETVPATAGSTPPQHHPMADIPESARPLPRASQLWAFNGATTPSGRAHGGGQRCAPRRTASVSDAFMPSAAQTSRVFLRQVMAEHDPCCPRINLF